MATWFGKELSIRSFVNYFQFVCVLLFLSFIFLFDDGMCDLIVLVPDHCLFIFTYLQQFLR